LWVWGMGFGPPTTPPNPQSPIPIPKEIKIKQLKLKIINNLLLLIKNIIDIKNNLNHYSDIIFEQINK